MNFTDFGQSPAPGVPGREFDRPGSERTVHLSDGKTIKVVREDPYGFWVIKWSAGAAPAAISGNFTNAELALRALDGYLSQDTFRTERVDEPAIKTPPLQYKKAKDGKMFSV